MAARTAGIARSVRMKPELWKAYKAAAESMGMTRNALIAETLEKHLPRRKRKRTGT